MNTRKPIRLPLGDTEQMLEQWGLWRMDGMGWDCRTTSRRPGP